MNALRYLLLISFFSLSACVTYPGSIWYYDLKPETLAGSNFHDPTHLNVQAGKTMADFIQERQAPLIVASSVDNATSLKLVRFVDSEGYIGACYVAGFGQLKSVAPLPIALRESLAGLEPSKGKVLVVNNLQIEATTNGLLEFWNNWMGSLVYRHNSFTIVAEIAEISPRDLERFLTGQSSKPAEEPEVKRKIIVFRGIVHKALGSNVTVMSARTAAARPGTLVIFRNRAGAQVATGKVVQVSHTNIKVRLSGGRVQKGFTAVVLR